LEPHADSRQATEDVEWLQSELANVPMRGAAHGHPGRMQGVPQRSLAMLICKVQLSNHNAVQFYPRRPPMESTNNINVKHEELVLPAFIIHFS
jgi:hypothetical protein